MKIKKELQYSIKMLKLNKKLYINLIIVLTISFTFFLGILLYFDEKHYNQNKEILSKPDELITVSNPNEKQMKPIKKDLDKDINTTSYDYFVQGTSKSNIDIEIYAVPSGIQQIFLDDTSYVNINEKNDNFEIKDDEIYVYKEFLEIYSNIKYIDVPIKLNNGNEVTKRYKIIGYFTIEGQDVSSNINEIVYDANEKEVHGRTSFIIKQPENLDFYKENTATIIYTKNVEKTLSLLDMYNVEYNAPILWKNMLNEEIKKTKIMESIIIIILYITLGINIKSIGANTLERRKYEVGIQRTVGAKKKDIVFQFVMESAIVTIIALTIAVWINLLINCVCKLWYYYFYGDEIIIYMSYGSAIKFLIICFLIVAFVNYIFAKEVLNVEVIKYLKES